MPPPTPPTGFTLDARPNGAPAPPPGFKLDARAPVPPTGFTLDAPVASAAPAPPPGFTLDPPLEPSIDGQMTPALGDELDQEPPIETSLLESLGETASEWGDVFAGLPGKARAAAAAAIAAPSAALKAHTAEVVAKPMESEGLAGWINTKLWGEETPEDLERHAAHSAEWLAAAEEELDVIRATGADMAPTEGATFAQRGLEQAVTSAISNAPALAVGVATRNPTLAAATMYPTTQASSFADLANEYEDMAAQREAETLKPQTASERMADFARAGRHAHVQATLETATEMLPFGALLKRGTPAVKRLAEVLVAELPGETIATLTQEIDHQLALQPEGEATLDAVFKGLEEGGKQIPETLVATILGSAGQTAPVAAIEAVAERASRSKMPVAPRVEPTIDGEPEAAPADVDVEAQLGAHFGDELEAAVVPKDVAAPTARKPSEAWRADPDAGQGVPFAFLGETPEEAAGYLIENGEKIQAVTAAGDVVGEFDGPDQAAIALEDAIGAVQTSAPAAPAQGFGDELAELGGAPVPKEATAGDVITKQSGAEIPVNESGLPSFGNELSAPTADQGVTAPAEAKTTVNASNMHPGDALSVPPAASPITSVPSQEGAGAATGGVERRANRRGKRVSEMTPDELRQQLLTHELTGIPNRRAYEEAPKLATQTAVDVDSLKWVNDNMGHDSGNELLKAVGEAIRAETGNAYHLSGDEFAVQSNTPQEGEAVMRRVNERLAGAVISVTMPDGKVVTVSGLGVSYGSGKNLGEADAALQGHKAQRHTRGERAARGVAPPGASSVSTETGRQGDEGAAPVEERADEADDVDELAEDLGLPADRAAQPPAEAPVDETGEHITLAGRFAHHEKGSAEDVEIDGGDLELGESPEHRRARAIAGATQEREIAIKQLLGKAKNAPAYRFVKDDGLPADVVKRMQLTPGHVWKGAFDPTTNKVWLNQDEIETTGEAAWYAMHEIAGHYGIKGAIGQLGAPDRSRIQRALALAAQNNYVDGLAAAIKLQRHTLSYEQSIEEALAELAAGIRTRDFNRLQRKYGLEVPAAYTGKKGETKPAWRRAFDRFVETIGRLMDKALGYHVTDEQILEFLEGAWRYVQTGQRAAAAPGQEVSLAGEQTESAAFKKWFGESEVVDAKGKPLRMYHATQADVDEFRSWSHFGSARAANDRGRSVRRFDEVVGRTERVGASRTMPVYLSIQNALRMRDMAAQELEDDSETAQREIYTRQWEDPNDVAESLLEMGEISIDEFEKVRGSHDKIAKVLQSKGYDGIVYENQVEGVDPEDGVGDDSYIVFKPAQVKSAVGNRGTFDAGAGDVSLAEAYHGSPHKFDKFSLEHVGRGEGAQAYGWGLYFAETKGVADEYRGALSRREWFGADGKPIAIGGERWTDAMALEYASDDQNQLPDQPTPAQMKKYLERAAEALDRQAGFAHNAYGKDTAQMYLRAAVRIRELAGEGITLKRGGGTYTVEIDDAALASMIDYDAPMSEQSPAARAAFRKIENEIGVEFEWDRSGRSAYARVGNVMNRNDDVAAAVEQAVGKSSSGAFNEAVSLLFAKYGIPGARYSEGKGRNDVLNAMSEIPVHGGRAKALEHWREKLRKAEAGDANESAEAATRIIMALEGNYPRNIVVFDDSIVTIKEINGEKVTPKQSDAIVERSQDPLGVDGVREGGDRGGPRRRARPPRSPARAEPGQGELFTKEDARPGTNAKQLELANELLREWADSAKKGTPKIKTLATAFNREFRADHTASLIGKRLREPREFALMAQTFRDPRYETLRYFFTDKAGKVIAETAVSSRLPGSSSVLPIGADEQWLISMIKRVGAEGLEVMHNHPSGNSMPSEADRRLTRNMAKIVGMPIRHLIINSNEYSVIHAEASGQEWVDEHRTKLTELPKDKLYTPRGSRALRPLMNRVIGAPHDVYFLSKEIKTPANKVAIIGLSARHDVKAIGEMRLGATRSRNELEEALKAFGIQNGSHSIVVAGVAPGVFDAGKIAYQRLLSDGYLLDVIDTDGRSLAETSTVARGGKEFGVGPGEGTEVGSGKPLGVGGKQEAERGERRKQPPAVVHNKAQRELALEAAQRDLDELIDPRITETSAFKRWFGKSKVVDAKGRPLVVYHGTSAKTDFRAFEETTDVGFHFGTAKAAADRLGLYPDSTRKTALSYSRVIPAYLSIKNPLRLEDLSEWSTYEVADALAKAGVITEKQRTALRDEATNGVAAGDMAQITPEELRKLLEPKGYDGIVYLNDVEGIQREPFAYPIDDVEIRKEPNKAHSYVAYGPDGKYLTSASTERHVLEQVEQIFKLGDAVQKDSWIALRPQQIKSAIGNRGTFSDEAEEIDLATGPPQKGKGGGVQKISWKPGKNYVDMYRSKGPPGTPTRATVRAEELEIPKEPIRAQHVIDLFQRLFKFKLYEGKPFSVRGALGYFRPSNFEIRNKYRNDLEVAAHEVFHWIDRTYPTLRKLYHLRRYADELKGVSYDTTKIFEGFAEFGRLFMTQEAEAIERLPTFYEAFVREARDAGILDKLEEVQRLMHQWYLQGAEARGRSKIGTSKAPIKQRIDKMADGFIDRAIASSLDARQAAKVIERETRGDIADDAAMSPYKSIRLLGGARSTINTFLNYSTLKWSDRGDLERNGVGLRQIFEPIAPVFDEAMGYFVALRADELRKYSKENLLTKDETAALVERAKKTGKLEQIQRAHEQYQQFTKRLTAFAVQSGILDAKTKELWEQLYQNYVPFYRVAEKFGTLDPRMAGGTQGGLFRKLTGGTANIADVFENVTLNTALVVHASLKNVAKRQLFAAIESSPVGQRYAVRIPESTEQRKVGISQIERVLKEFAKEAADKYHATPQADQATRIEYGQMAMLAKRLASRDPDSGQLTMSDVMSQARFFFTGNPPTIPDKEMVLVRGEPRWFQIGDPVLWDMLVDINYHQPIGLTEKVLGLAKRTLTRGVTASPEFQIANIIRDTFNAFAMSKGGQIPVVDALKAIRDIWKESDDYVDFLANAGGFGNATGEEAKRLRVRMGAKASLRAATQSPKGAARALIATPAAAIDLWDKWGQSFELATRLAEYKKVRQIKGPEGEPKYTKREAAYQGREISTDFAMRGHSALARWASISLPFFNARMQGLYRIEREINERRGRQSPLRGENALRYATRAFTGLTMPALLVYWFLNRGDDDYEELGEELKSLNTVVPMPDGTQLLIPRPFETGALFMEIPIRTLQYIETRDGERYADAMMFMLANTFNFNPAPQLVQPPLAIARNRQWNGLPVVPRSLQNVEPREQFQPWTPDTYKVIGEQFNVSPLKLQAIVEGYLGTMGIYAVAASDALMTPSDTAGDEPSRRLSQYPLFRRFMREPPYTNTSFEQRFYDLLDETTKVVDTARKMRREARQDDLEAYLGDNERAALFAISGPTTDVMELAADMNAQMRAIRSDDTLSGEEKTAQILEIQAEQNALFRDAIKDFNDALLEESRRALEQGR